MAVQGWVLWGFHPRSLQPCVAAPRGAPPEIQPEPPVCLFMPPVPRSPTLHHQLNILDFDLKDRKSIKWKYLGRKVEACLLVMRGKKKPHNFYQSSYSLHCCSRFILCVYACVNMYLFSSKMVRPNRCKRKIK